MICLCGYLGLSLGMGEAAQGTEESQEFGSNYRFVGLHSGEGITPEESD